jgi:YfiR/HmsC-like
MNSPLQTHWRRASLWLAVLGLCLASASLVCAEGYSEDAVKAVFLSRFAEYVEWPPDALAGSQFTIVVLGDDGVAAELQRLLPNYPIKRLPARVKKIRKVQEIGDAQILYIGAGHPDDLRAAVAALHARPVLLVTDDEHGLEAGGAVNFMLVDQRVRFEVSLVAAERCALTINSGLLSVAARVQGGRRRSELVCGKNGGEDDHLAACAQHVAVHSAAGGKAHPGGVDANGRPAADVDSTRAPSETVP